MGQTIDNLIAFKILYGLVQPFDKTDAFRLGIIDKDGKLLKSADELKTDKERDAYNYFHRLLFNLKRLIAKVPGGSSMLGSLVAAYFLIKEGIEQEDLSRLDEKFEDLIKEVNEGACFVEEELIVSKFLAMMNDDVGLISEEGEGVAPANSVGSGQMASPEVPLGTPAAKKRNNWKDLPKAFGITSFEVSDKAFNGFRNAKAKGAKWDDHLVPSDDDKETYAKIKQYSRVYSGNPILIKSKSLDAYQRIK